MASRNRDDDNERHLGRTTEDGNYELRGGLSSRSRDRDDDRHRQDRRSWVDRILGRGHDDDRDRDRDRMRFRGSRDDERLTRRTSERQREQMMEDHDRTSWTPYDMETRSRWRNQQYGGRFTDEDDDDRRLRGLRGDYDNRQRQFASHIDDDGDDMRGQFRRSRNDAELGRRGSVEQARREEGRYFDRGDQQEYRQPSAFGQPQRGDRELREMRRQQQRDFDRYPREYLDYRDQQDRDYRDHRYQRRDFDAYQQRRDFDRYHDREQHLYDYGEHLRAMDHDDYRGIEGNEFSRERMDQERRAQMHGRHGWREQPRDERGRFVEDDDRYHHQRPQRTQTQYQERDLRGMRDHERDMRGMRDHDRDMRDRDMRDSDRDLRGMRDHERDLRDMRDRDRDLRGSRQDTTRDLSHVLGHDDERRHVAEDHGQLTSNGHPRGTNGRT